ncbi:glycosyl transferase family 1 [Kouleothrix aurantiaca]|uniref:Glycosyl transferase family 1 n=1 Tax=Kouleothrix aurantiaca TaxID=186479 RepID=A0A0P9DWX5_9CHLR|nr:glycosyl transferase family 1 [Kouleothrix aurantiaca]
MRIGFDISVLRIAQAGVLEYTRALLAELLHTGAQHEWTLLDLLPLNPGRPMQADSQLFNAPNTRVVRVPALQRGYLSMLPGARTGVAHSLAEHVDHALDRLWALAASGAVGLQLRAALGRANVFHCSDQFQYVPPRGAAVLTIHDLTTLSHPEFHVSDNTSLHSAKDRFAATRATHLIADSHSTKRDIERHLQVPSERITVVHAAAGSQFRPYTPTEIQATLHGYGLQHDGYILMVGTLEPRKNHTALINAYARLRATLAAEGIDAPPLAIAGAHGWKYEDILAAPGRAGVEQHVRWLGKVPAEHLPVLMAGAQVFAYPSLYEGFGLPVLEALACGAPVVAANNSSLPEVLGDAGLYCDALDTESIAQALGTLLRDGALRAQLRQAGPARAAQFSWERTARETLAVYALAAAAHKTRAK